MRIALGATPADVVRDVVWRGGKLAVAGIAAGLASAAAVMSALGQNSVYGLSRFDPLTYASTSLLVLLTALAGSYVPARRAARVEPVAALRSE